MEILTMKKKDQPLSLSGTLLAPPANYVKENTGILIGLAGMCVFLSLASEYFLTTDNMLNILRQVSTNSMLAFGMTFAIIIGGIDLSVGSVMAVAGMLTTGFIANNGFSIPAAVAIGLLAASGLGLFNGVMIAKTGIPPFIVTLAMYSMARGAAFLYSDGQPIRVMTGNFNKIGSGFIGPVSYPVIYMLVVFILLSFLLSKTGFGRHVYAVGGNREAARFSGINIAKIEIIVYTLIGSLAGISGIVLSARMYTGQPSMGQGSELDAIAAVVLGGTSFSGGVGTIGGTLLGALIIGVMNNGLNLLNVSSFLQLIAKGAVILLAVYVDSLKKGKK
ncbi:MAG: ABC transporter permease [bacterium]|nr:ABC transporter permease [bacterium]